MESSSPKTELVTKRHFFRRLRAPKQDVEHIGKVATVQTFYEGPFQEDDPDNINWVEWAPPSLPAPKRKKFEGAAVQVYKRLSSNKVTGVTESRSFYTYMIRLQSPFIREVFQEKFRLQGLNYDSWDCADSLRNHRALFHAREEIAEVAKTSDDELTQSHCEILCEVIEQNLANTLDGYESYEKDQMISYQHLWTLFPNGSVFATYYDSQLRAFRVRSSTEDSPLFVECEEIRFDGSRYGYDKILLEFPEFEGKVHVSKLAPFPFIDLNRNPGIRTQLLERNRKTLEYQSPQYLAHVPIKEKYIESHNVVAWYADEDEERVMIDPWLHGTFTKKYLDPLPGYFKEGTSSPEAPVTTIDNDGSNKKPRLTRPTEEDVKKNLEIVLEEEENILLLCPMLDGYSLRKDTWNSYSVTELQPLSLDRTVFDKVVFDEKKKELLRCLTELYVDSNIAFNDLIAGKGQCLLILLSGDPGTGKTLMAESLADHLERPLLRIGSIDDNLNEESKRGSEFKAKIDKATEWGGLVLFDEANFLVQERKGVENFISAFIRHIEYFKGIVFLTTNSTESIDAALLSRVQIHLTFPPLTAPRRVRVWNNFVKRLPSEIGSLSPSDVERLAKWKMNGRDIKNAINMAVAWCQKKNIPLTVDAVEDLVMLVNPFASKELLSANGKPDKNGVKVSAMEELNDSLLDF